MKNYDVVKAFFSYGRGCNTLHLRYNKSFDELVNYSTILLKRDCIDKILYVNISRYSVTTSKIQSYINEFLNSEDLDDFKIIYYYGGRYGDCYDSKVCQLKHCFSSTFNYDTYKIIKFENTNYLDSDYLTIARFYKKAYLNNKICKIFNKKKPYIKIDGHKIELTNINNDIIFN